MSLTIENTLPDFNEKPIPLEQAFSLTQKTIDRSLEITLIFVSQDDMFNLNNEFRGKPKPTDVLSLPIDTDVGEIYICPDYIQAEGYGPDRITHLWVHGLLHIAGYTHDGEDDFKIMQDLEINICEALGLPNPYSD